MGVRYLPILKWKQGERTAISQLSSAGRNGVTPHIVLMQAQFGGPRKQKKTTVSTTKIPLSASDYFAKQVEDVWGKTPFYLDAGNLAETASSHDLDTIRKSTNGLGLHLIPSTRLHRTPSYNQAIIRSFKADGRGIALRVSLDQMTSAATWVSSWPIPLGETDLIVDLGGSVASVLALGAPVHAAFVALHKGGAWRSVTVSGGSIPATLSGYPVGRTMLARSELALWSALQKASLSYQLDFGDYATIGPDAATEGIAGPVPINVKYTLTSEFAVYHGVRTKGPGSKPRDQQYRSHAKDIVKLPNRFPLAHCWGDHMIDAVANNPTASPGSPGSWVGFSVNRHIELTRSQLP
ncbi:hypothetical protein QBC99_001983 [Beijerinckia sp. GAS462]|nr:hypothetical protein [Beijerinckia sp. GAS462]SEC22271.1 Beta protein [Beijerinckia sp. 28-YEA-48]